MTDTLEGEQDKNKVIETVRKAKNDNEIAYALLDFNLPRLFANCYPPDIGFDLLQKWSDSYMNEIALQTKIGMRKQLVQEERQSIEEIVHKVNVTAKIGRMEVGLISQHAFEIINIATEEWIKILLQMKEFRQGVVEMLEQLEEEDEDIDDE